MDDWIIAFVISGVIIGVILLSFGPVRTSIEIRELEAGRKLVASAPSPNPNANVSFYIIILLLFILIAGGGYILYNKYQEWYG